MKTLRKRSLVVVLTNFREEDADELGAGAEAAAHAPPGARSPACASARCARSPSSRSCVERDAIEVAGAHLFAQARDDAFRRLAGRDAYLLDVEPEQLAVELVNRYRAVKRAGLL